MSENETGQTWATSKSLVRQAQEKRPEAWRKLSHIYTPLVYGWARKAGLREEDAADVVQDVFRAVAGALEWFRHDRPGDTFRGWLLTITKNELRGWFRHHARTAATGEGGSHARQMLEQVPEWVDDDSNAEIAGDPASEVAVVRRASELVKQDFQPRTWQAFWQTAVEGRPTAEVAISLTMSAAAVRQARFRVLSRLREVIEQCFA